MLSFKPTFSLSSFTFIRRLFTSSSLSAISVVSSAYLRLLIFLPAILIPACAHPTGLRPINITIFYLNYLFKWRRKWQPTPVFLPGESQGQRSLVAIYGVAQSRTRLERLSSSSSSRLVIQLLGAGGLVTELCMTLCDPHGW